MAKQSKATLTKTYVMWVPLDPQPNKVTDKMIVVKDNQIVEGAKEITDGCLVYGLQEIELDYMLNGKRRKALSDISRRIDAAKAEIGAMLSGIEKVTILDIAMQLPNSAERDADELKKFTEIQNEQIRTNTLEQKALDEPEAAQEIQANTATQAVLLAQRAAIFWNLNPDTMIAIAEFPGAFTEDYNGGFLAEFIQDTDEYVEELGKQPRKLQIS